MGSSTRNEDWEDVTGRATYVDLSPWRGVGRAAGWWLSAAGEEPQLGPGQWGR